MIKTPVLARDQRRADMFMTLSSAARSIGCPASERSAMRASNRPPDRTRGGISSRRYAIVAAWLLITAGASLWVQSAQAVPSKRVATPGSSFTGSSSPSSSFSGTGTSGGSGEGDGGSGSGDSGLGRNGGSDGSSGISSTGASRVAGMTVASVRRLQADLARLGYFHHVVTGFYGVVTTAAVRQFQRTAGLKTDGIWGPISAAALRRRLPKS